MEKTLTLPKHEEIIVISMDQTREKYNSLISSRPEFWMVWRCYGTPCFQLFRTFCQCRRWYFKCFFFCPTNLIFSLVLIIYSVESSPEFICILTVWLSFTVLRICPVPLCYFFKKGKFCWGSMFFFLRFTVAKMFHYIPIFCETFVPCNAKKYSWNQ